jgi:hypothetical protein
VAFVAACDLKVRLQARFEPPALFFLLLDTNWKSQELRGLPYWRLRVPLVASSLIRAPAQ